MNKLFFEKIYDDGNRTINNDLIPENNKRNNNIFDISLREIKFINMDDKIENKIIEENANMEIENKDLIKIKSNGDNEKKNTQNTHFFEVKSHKVSIVSGVNNNDIKSNNNFIKINQGEEPSPSTNINTILKIQSNNKGIIRI